MAELQWNLLDTNAPARAAASFDPIGAYDKLQLAKMNTLAAKKAKLAMGDEEAYRNALAAQGSNPGMVKVQKEQQAFDKEELERVSKQFGVMKEAADRVASAPPGQATKWAVEHTVALGKLFGKSEQEVLQDLQSIKQRVDEGGDDAVREDARLLSMDVGDKLQKIEMVNLGDRVVPVQTNPNAQGFQGNALQVGMSPSAAAQYSLGQQQLAMRGKELEQRKTEKATAPGGTKWPLLAEVMGLGQWQPSGRMTAPMMDAFEGALQVAKANGVPLTAKVLRDMEFQAAKNVSTGRTAGGRLTVARKQNIEAAYGLLKDMQTTAKKIDFSNLKIAAIGEKFAKGQLQDPDLTEYMTQRADALFVLGNALKQNGLTDKAIEIEEEAAAPTVSPKAFDAWYNTQLRALNRAAEEINKDFKYDIETAETVPPGQGGQGGQPTAPKKIGRFTVEVE